MSDHFPAWGPSKGILLQTSTAYHQEMEGQTYSGKKEVGTIVRACELEENQSLNELSEIQLKRNRRYNLSCGSSPFHTLHVFTPRFGQAQMLQPLHKIVESTDRYAQVTNDIKLAK